MVSDALVAVFDRLPWLNFLTWSDTVTAIVFALVLACGASGIWLLIDSLLKAVEDSPAGHPRTWLADAPPPAPVQTPAGAASRFPGVTVTVVEPKTQLREPCAFCTLRTASRITGDASIAGDDAHQTRSGRFSIPVCVSCWSLLEQGLDDGGVLERVIRVQIDSQAASC